VVAVFVHGGDDAGLSPDDRRPPGPIPLHIRVRMPRRGSCELDRVVVAVFVNEDEDAGRESGRSAASRTDSSSHQRLGWARVITDLPSFEESRSYSILTVRGCGHRVRKRWRTRISFPLAPPRSGPCPSCRCDSSNELRGSGLGCFEGRVGRTWRSTGLSCFREARSIEPDSGPCGPERRCLLVKRARGGFWNRAEL
jgi:hypothetical protein